MPHMESCHTTVLLAMCVQGLNPGKAITKLKQSVAHGSPV
jgi:hypothetical protein